MSYYRLWVSPSTTAAPERTEFLAKGTRPAKALTELAAEAGLTLASQDGRYGRLDDGRTVMALTEPWGRVDRPDARTTRL